MFLFLVLVLHFTALYYTFALHRQYTGLPKTGFHIQFCSISNFKTYITHRRQKSNEISVHCVKVFMDVLCSAKICMLEFRFDIQNNKHNYYYSSFVEGNFKRKIHKTHKDSKN